MIKFEAPPGSVYSRAVLWPSCLSRPHVFSHSVLSLGLDHRGNCILDSLMLAVWIHKTYMESYKRVIRPSSFTTEWKSRPHKDFITILQQFQGST